LPIRDFLAPFFFVIIGAQVNVAVFMQPGVIEVGLVISLLVALGKIIGGMSAFFHVGWKKGFATGVAMIPRGGLSLITAGIGLSLGAITQRVLFEIVFMTVATIVIVPIILPYVLRFAGVSISKGETDQKVA
jgi:Kef-type K+ transport system membrane component KefB